ncbi:hypothetical protein Sm713_20650 [Streptomyces sp. TS71-3]|nr:hypothetical protein Sm713_20650 [Streptomyces sp. TS71-3]
MRLGLRGTILPRDGSTPDHARLLGETYNDPASVGVRPRGRDPSPGQAVGACDPWIAGPAGTPGGVPGTRRPTGKPRLTRDHDPVTISESGTLAPLPLSVARQ